MARYKVLGRIDRGVGDGADRKITVYLPKGDLDAKKEKAVELGLPAITKNFKVDSSGWIDLPVDEALPLVEEWTLAPRTSAERKAVAKRKHPRDPEVREKNASGPMRADTSV